MKIKAIHHIKLSVTNLERSKEFYSKFPGAKIVADYPDFIMFSIGNFNLGLTTHNGKLDQKRFSEFNVGMDHVAFLVEKEGDLEDVIKTLDELGINHSGIESLSNNTKIITFRDPDNIQLEFCYRDS